MIIIRALFTNVIVPCFKHLIKSVDGLMDVEQRAAARRDRREANRGSCGLLLRREIRKMRKPRQVAMLVNLLCIRQVSREEVVVKKESLCQFLARGDGG
jgi:hypothetical protein